MLTFTLPNVVPLTVGAPMNCIILNFIILKQFSV
jgi:hypothetical protein